MFLFIPQYFTGLKLVQHRARNLLNRAAVQCFQQWGGKSQQMHNNSSDLLIARDARVILQVYWRMEAWNSGFVQLMNNQLEADYCRSFLQKPPAGMSYRNENLKYPKLQIFHQNWTTTDPKDLLVGFLLVLIKCF